MRVITARCTGCDLPLASQADHDATPEGEGDHMCWRARALAAEARSAEFEVHLRDIELAAFTGVQTAVASMDDTGEMRRAIFHSIRDMVRSGLAGGAALA